MSMQHLIKKQFLELTLDKRLDHFRTQQMVSNHYWNNIVPLLEKIFDNIGKEEEVIQLDRLEIDLGVLSEKSIEKNEWETLLQAKMEELLAVMMHTTSTTKTIKHQPRRLSTFQQWFFYMQRGYLPWNTIDTNEQWYQLVLEALAVDFESVQMLRNIIRKDSRVLKRIVLQHHTSFLVTLSEIFTAEKQLELPDIINELVLLTKFIPVKEGVLHVGTEKEITNELWQHVLLLSVSVNENISVRKIAPHLVVSFVQQHLLTYKLPRAITAKLNASLSLITGALKNLKGSEQVESGTISKTKKELKAETKNKKETPAKGEEDNNTREQQNKVEFLNDLFVKPAAVQKEYSDPEVKTTIVDEIDEDGVFVTNAGVVLLHPFLNMFFTRLNLLKAGNFIDPMLHKKALYLLHYLATGNTDAEEHELLIAKVVCAYPVEEAVEKTIAIPQTELQEADDMISAAIQQWDKLKNTSVAALREGFLQRSGKLCKRNGSLYLQVEKSAIDILLDYLPWNLSMIKLPWMKEIVRVEWR